MAYTHTTYAQLKAQLAKRLGDVNSTFWIDAELGLYVKEALQTWGLMSLYWRAQSSFNPTANIEFYNLPDKIPTLLGQTVTDQDLATLIEYHLMEPATPSAWTGSEQFTLADLETALQQRYTEFQMETGLQLSTFSIVLPGSSSGRVDLPDTTMEVRRCQWLSTSGSYSILRASDEKALQHISPAWNTTAGAAPYAYTVIAELPLSLQVAPPPLELGTLKFVSISSGAALALAIGITITLPPDVTPIIKWGALATLLGRDGQSNDTQRADYCEQRWREGIAAAKIYPSVLTVRVNDGYVPLTSLTDLDSLNPSWPGTTGTPTSAAMSGHNLLALYPVPNTTELSIMVETVQKAPLPSVDGDFIQIGREHLAMILDYAQHLALFKVGGEEWAASMGHYERLVRAAAEENERLRAYSTMFDALKDASREDEQVKPQRKARGY